MQQPTVYDIYFSYLVILLFGLDKICFTKVSSIMVFVGSYSNEILFLFQKLISDHCLQISWLLCIDEDVF